MERWSIVPHKLYLLRSKIYLKLHRLSRVSKGGEGGGKGADLKEAGLGVVRTEDGRACRCPLVQDWEDFIHAKQ